MPKLFSIKKEFSDLIFRNEKKVEFRRQNINVNQNEKCFVYTSNPEKKITGYFIVKEKIRAPLKELWNKTKDFAGISFKKFREYFIGCKQGTAIIFKYVKKFKDAIDLRDIKKRIENFQPPQSYYNLNKNIILALSIFLPDESID
jgi:predicted transcriptional regulator